MCLFWETNLQYSQYVLIRIQRWPVPQARKKARNFGEDLLEDRRFQFFTVPGAWCSLVLVEART